MLTFVLRCVPEGCTHTHTHTFARWRSGRWRRGADRGFERGARDGRDRCVSCMSAKGFSSRRGHAVVVRVHLSSLPQFALYHYTNSLRLQDRCLTASPPFPPSPSRTSLSVLRLHRSVHRSADVLSGTRPRLGSTVQWPHNAYIKLAPAYTKKKKSSWSLAQL